MDQFLEFFHSEHDDDHLGSELQKTSGLNISHSFLKIYCSLYFIVS